jgi:6-pyruvoyltetrahydropterin/6-carboxytetrahydropterin synthase
VDSEKNQHGLEALAGEVPPLPAKASMNPWTIFFRRNNNYFLKFNNVLDMYKIITKIQYEYAHRLIYHQEKCRNLHGHSGEAVIELGSNNLNDNGFVMDFGDLKAPIKQWINEYWDHSFLANEKDPLLPTIQAAGLKVFTFPAEPSAEVMAKRLFEQVSSLNLPQGVVPLRVTIRETCTGLACYEPRILVP